MKESRKNQMYCVRGKNAAAMKSFHIFVLIVEIYRYIYSMWKTKQYVIKIFQRAHLLFWYLVLSSLVWCAVQCWHHFDRIEIANLLATVSGATSKHANNHISKCTSVISSLWLTASDCNMPIPKLRCIFCNSTQVPYIRIFHWIQK